MLTPDAESLIRNGDATEKKVADLIRKKLILLRTAIREGAEGDLIVWAIEGQLACCQRPLRDDPRFGERGRSLPLAARPKLEEWLTRMGELGIRAVICLSHPKELAYYENALPGGLLEAYRGRGWEVSHIPWMDPCHARTPRERREIMNAVQTVKKDALVAFSDLPKPVLMHCSAGVDRTPPVAAYIVIHRAEGEPGWGN